jgi:hypothetical protein
MKRELQAIEETAVPINVVLLSLATLVTFKESLQTEELAIALTSLMRYSSSSE